MTEADKLGLALGGVLSHFEMDSTILNGAADWSNDDLLAITLSIVESIRAVALLDASDLLRVAETDACVCDECMPSTAVH